MKKVITYGTFDLFHQGHYNLLKRAKDLGDYLIVRPIKYDKVKRETVFEAFKNHLLKCGFSKEYVDNFKLVLWDIPNNYYGPSTSKFEALANTPNIFHMSGFDPAGLAFLTGTKQVTTIPRTPEELFETAMQQELIQLLEL